MLDQVNHPSHYNMGSIEVIDAIESWGLGFHEGNVVKYIARAKHKGDETQDLLKAKWYLDRLIENINKNAPTLLDAKGSLTTAEAQRTAVAES